MSSVFTSKIIRLGDSFAVIIPKQVMEKEKLKEGINVQVSIQEKKLLEGVKFIE